MDFFEVIKRRRSVRAYTSQEIDAQTLQTILQCANDSPSAGNLQAYEVVVVRDQHKREGLYRVGLEQQALLRAPVVLVFFQNPARSAAKYGKRGVELYSVQDATIACAHAQLAATALGLGSVWIGAFYPERVARLLNSPPGLVPVALLAIGHPDEDPPAAGRRPLSDLVREETF